MNNTQPIEPRYVTFDNSKLLKENNFEIACRNYYELALKSRKDKQDGYSGAFGWKKGELNRHQCGYFMNGYKGCDYSNEMWYQCACPEQWMVLEWLSKKHGILIKYDTDCYGANWHCRLSVCSKEVWENIELRSKITTAYINFSEHKSQQEAVEEAIGYTLKNILIK